MYGQLGLNQRQTGCNLNVHQQAEAAVNLHESGRFFGGNRLVEERHILEPQLGDASSRSSVLSVRLFAFSSVRVS